MIGDVSICFSGSVETIPRGLLRPMAFIVFICPSCLRSLAILASIRSSELRLKKQSGRPKLPLPSVQMHEALQVRLQVARRHAGDVNAVVVAEPDQRIAV